MPGLNTGKGHIRIEFRFAVNSWGACAFDLGVISKKIKGAFAAPYMLYTISDLRN
jgi:hypothetical protein